MKRDTATRLAAAEADELSLEDAERVIQTFLRRLTQCPACEDGGRVRYGRSVNVVGRGIRGDETFQIDRGTEGNCPICGGSGGGDPEWVEWRCESSTGFGCDPMRPDTQGPGHETCHWRLVIPLREVTDG